MKKTIGVVCALLLSTAALAAEPDFLGMDFAHGGHGKFHKCLKAGWDAANPTDQQNTQAEAIINDAKTVYNNHKDAIKKDMESIKTAWKKYPIIKTEVTTAQSNLERDALPVIEAMTDAGVDSLNLLTAGQRTEFDKTMEACMKAAD